MTVIKSKYLNDKFAKEEHTHPGYASSTHVHTEYAAQNHEHTGYVSTGTAPQTINGNKTFVATTYVSQIVPSTSSSRVGSLSNPYLDGCFTRLTLVKHEYGEPLLKIGSTTIDEATLKKLIALI